MNTVRTYKLFLLGINIPIKDKEIIVYVNNLLSDLTPFTVSDFPDSIFYIKKENNTEAQCILEISSDFIKLRNKDFKYLTDIHHLTHLDGIAIFDFFEYMIDQKLCIKRNYTTTMLGETIKIVENKYQKMFYEKVRKQNINNLVDSYKENNISYSDMKQKLLINIK